MDEKKIAYKRVLLKLSGEALSGDAGTGLDFKVMAESAALSRSVQSRALRSASLSAAAISGAA